jgi:hypothetical protein
METSTQKNSSQSSLLTAQFQKYPELKIFVEAQINSIDRTDACSIVAGIKKLFIKFLKYFAQTMDYNDIEDLIVQVIKLNKLNLNIYSGVLGKYQGTPLHYVFLCMLERASLEPKCRSSEWAEEYLSKLPIPPDEIHRLRIEELHIITVCECWSLYNVMKSAGANLDIKDSLGWSINDCRRKCWIF